MSLPPVLMSIADYGASHGVSKTAAQKWQKAGALVMRGQQVCVAESDESLKSRYLGRYNFMRAAYEPAARPKKATAIKEMSGAQIEQFLLANDWQHKFDWDEEAIIGRAKLAAECVGLVMVQSDVLDDGHWGGWQLRLPGYSVATNWDDQFCRVAAGYGYELDPFGVLEACRSHVLYALREFSDPDATYPVRPDLLYVLTLPHGPGQTPPAPVDLKPQRAASKTADTERSTS